MKVLSISKQKLFQVRSLKCKTQDKFNRIYKIAALGDDLLYKFDQFAQPVVTERAQCALAAKICIATGIRIGNEESAEGYMTKPHPMHKEAAPEFRQTYGLTTLTRKHVSIRGGKVTFNFIGKKGVQQLIVITDKVLVAQIRELYNSTTEPTLFTVNDAQVRNFVKRSIGKAFMVKDLRTLHANLIATEVISTLCKQPKPERKKELNAEVKYITEQVAARLGNTPGISKRSYIDPLILEWHTTKRWN